MNAPYFLIDTHFFWHAYERLPRDGNGQYTIDPGAYTEIHAPVLDPTSDRFGAYYVRSDVARIIARATVGGF